MLAHSQVSVLALCPGWNGSSKSWLLLVLRALPQHVASEKPSLTIVMIRHPQI